MNYYVTILLMLVFTFLPACDTERDVSTLTFVLDDVEEYNDTVEDVAENDSVEAVTEDAAVEVMDLDEPKS